MYMEDLTYRRKYFHPGGEEGVYGVGCTSYNGLNVNGEGLPERGIGISPVEVDERDVKKCK